MTAPKPEPRVEAQWELFRHAVGIHDAPPIQQREMRRAFYAGASMLVGELMTMLDPGTEPTDADLEKMDGIWRELKEFNERVKRGEA